MRLWPCFRGRPPTGTSMSLNWRMRLWTSFGVPGRLKLWRPSGARRLLSCPERPLPTRKSRLSLIGGLEFSLSGLAASLSRKSEGSLAITVNRIPELRTRRRPRRTPSRPRPRRDGRRRRISGPSEAIAGGGPPRDGPRTGGVRSGSGFSAARPGPRQAAAGPVHTSAVTRSPIHLRSPAVRQPKGPRCSTRSRAAGPSGSVSTSER